MAVSKRNFLARLVGSVVLAAIILPAYFIEGGRYLNLVLRFGFLMALIEFATVVCESNFLPLHPNEYGITGFIFIELLTCLGGVGTIPIGLLGGCIFVCVITDICAYLMGNFVGGQLIKKRPFPKISPNKSYEGLIFGVCLGIISAFIWTLLMRETDSPVAYWQLLIAAPLSVVGDLIESRFKRLYGVKDANDFIIDTPVLGWLEKPLGGRNGHGGYFDRLDSLALVLMVQLFIP